MKMNFTILFTFCFFLAFIFTFTESATKHERFGTLYYKRTSPSARQQRLLDNGYICADVSINPPLTFFENSFNQTKLRRMLNAVILSPFKTSSHPEFSPLLSFASFFTSEKMEICTVDNANLPRNQTTTANKNLVGVNWMLVLDEFLGTLSGNRLADNLIQDNINIAMSLDIRPNQPYAFLTGMCHHDYGAPESQIIGHYDTVWLQRMDHNSKLALFAWTDIRGLRNEVHGVDSKQQVLVSGMAFPSFQGKPLDNGLEFGKHFDSGSISFSWPEDLEAIGYCHNLAYNVQFAFEPTLFVGLEFNMNTESIYLTSWAEEINQVGALVCVSIVNGVKNIERLIRETKETGGLKVHWAAFNQIYTDEELKDQEIPLEVALSITDLTVPHSREEQEKLLLDTLNLATHKPPTGFEFIITNVLAGINSIDIYFTTSHDDYIKTASVEIEAVDLSNDVHAQYISDYKTNERTDFKMEYGKAPVFSIRSVDGKTCSKEVCEDESTSGQIFSTRKLIIEGMTNVESVDDTHTISLSETCNAPPCSFSNTGYTLYNKDNTYVVEKISTSNVGLIIGILIAAVLVICIIVLFYRYRLKARNVFKKAQSRFHQFT